MASFTYARHCQNQNVLNGKGYRDNKTCEPDPTTASSKK